MSFADASAAIDDSVVSLFGEATEYAPLNGPPSSPSGVFFDPNEPATAFVVSVEGNDPVLFYLKSDVPSPARGDVIRVRDREYAVKAKALDEAGLVAVTLELRS